MTDVLQWLVDLPGQLLPILNNFVHTLNMPVRDWIYGFWPDGIGIWLPGWSLWGDLTVLGAIIGVGLPTVLAVNFFKWVIGIIT